MLKIGIIGAGRIGKVHAEGISKSVRNAQVMAIADPLMNADTENWARSLGIGSVGSDYRSILSNEAIDAVLVCSPTDTHAVISLEALDSGKHVFCEKPVDTDPARIAEVIRKVGGTGLKFQVGFNRRFDHNFSALRKAVEDGRVGDVHMVKVTSRDPGAPSPEYVRRSGGMFLDMTIHDFDMVRYLSGSEVEEIHVNAAVLIDPGIGLAGDVDTAILSMKLSNGALAVIDNSRRAAYGYDQRAEVFGVKGSVHTGNDTASTLVFSGNEGIISEKPLYFFLERYMQSFARELSEFADAVEKNTAVPVTAEDGLKAVLIAIAARKSWLEGRSVKISEVS
jgi:myo-inositol 2-dehydrogenase / D-chiro-inositol 1-dehydrogenase